MTDFARVIGGALQPLETNSAPLRPRPTASYTPVLRQDMDPMSPGAHLSQAARLAIDIQRARVAILLHLDESGVVADIVLQDTAELVADDGGFADWLQRLADEYGRLTGSIATPREGVHRAMRGRAPV
jgi:hypothetical protein